MSGGQQMQVDPARLVELADACASLGEAVGTTVVAALTYALDRGAGRGSPNTPGLGAEDRASRGSKRAEVAPDARPGSPRL